MMEQNGLVSTVDASGVPTHGEHDGHDKKSRKGNKCNKILCGVLGVLTIAAVGLTAGIIAVVNQKGHREEVAETPAGEEEGIVIREPESSEEELSMTSQINREVRDMDIDDAQAYLDEQIEASDSATMDFRMTLSKMWIYVNNDQPNKALPIAETIDETALEDRQRLDYYDAMKEIYYRLNDMTKAQEYADKWSDLYDIIFDGGEGGF